MLNEVTPGHSYSNVDEEDDALFSSLFNNVTKTLVNKIRKEKLEG